MRFDNNTMKKITIADIARMAGVSKATVSRVINNNPDGMSDHVRKRIRDIIESVGYQPNMIARSLVTASPKEIALIIPDIANPFYPALLRGLEDYAQKNAYTVFVCNTDGDVNKEEEYLLKFAEKRIDGIILTSYANEYSKHNLNRIQSFAMPKIVMLDYRNDVLDYSALIQCDNIYGGYVAVRHLLEQGRRKIVHITGKMHMLAVIDRLVGYRKALEEFGLLYDETLVHFGQFAIESGEEMAEKLLSTNREFDAIFCGNDLIAMGVISLLNKNGKRVPEDVAVVGFDNTFFSRILSPSLTTVDQNAYEQGRLAAETLISIIEGNPIEKSPVLIKPELIIRNSSVSR